MNATTTTANEIKKLLAHLGSDVAKIDAQAESYRAMFNPSMAGLLTCHARKIEAARAGDVKGAIEWGVRLTRYLARYGA